jgi:hypothetical protein
MYFTPFASTREGYRIYHDDYHQDEKDGHRDFVEILYAFVYALVHYSSAKPQEYGHAGKRSPWGSHEFREHPCDLLGAARSELEGARFSQIADGPTTNYAVVG